MALLDTFGKFKQNVKDMLSFGYYNTKAQQAGSQATSVESQLASRLGTQISKNYAPGFGVAAPVTPRIDLSQYSRFQAPPLPQSSNVATQQSTQQKVATVPTGGQQAQGMGGQSIQGMTTPTIPATATTTPNGMPTPTPPAAPAVSPDLIKAQESAAKLYQDALKISPEEIATQEEIDKLVESTKKAYLNTENQAIPLDFITGQIASIEKRALGLSEPLERKMARMEAARKSSLEASKFALERADKAVEGEKTAIQKEKEAAESKRQFDLKYGLDQKQSELLERKFEEDKRQFGLTYAQGERKIAADLAKKTQEAADAQDVKSSASLGTINNINQLLAGDYEGITGGIFGRSILTRLGTTNQKEDALFKNIQASLALGARQLIKGSGAISDFEARTLQAAASLFGSGETSTLTNEDFKNAMIQIRGALMSNNGLEVTVKVTDPEDGTAKILKTNRDGIGDIIADGGIVEYQ